MQAALPAVLCAFLVYTLCSVSIQGCMPQIEACNWYVDAFVALSHVLRACVVCCTMHDVDFVVLYQGVPRVRLQ